MALAMITEMANAQCIVSCASCPVGVAAQVSQGGRCPLVDRKWKRGAVIHVEGEAAEQVRFLKRGTVVLTRAGAGDGSPGRARALRQVGHFIGLEALVRNTYLDSARAVSDAVLCGAPRAFMDIWLGGHGSPLRMAFEQVLRAECDDLPTPSAPDGRAVQRVARWILNERSERIETPVPRRVTAGLLGMVPETFSRALARLTALGAIDVTRTAVSVRDVAVLQAVDGGELGA